MKIFWNRDKLAIGIQCINEKEFDIMLDIISKTTKKNYSIESKE